MCRLLHDSRDNLPFLPPPPLFIFPGCQSTLRGSRLRSRRLPTGRNVLGLVRHGVEASAVRQGRTWAAAARLWFTTPGLEKASVPIGLLLMKSLRFYGVERSRAGLQSGGAPLTQRWGCRHRKMGTSQARFASVLASGDTTAEGVKDGFPTET